MLFQPAFILEHMELPVEMVAYQKNTSLRVPTSLMF